MSEPNWANRTMWTGDNLDIMRGLQLFMENGTQEGLMANLHGIGFLQLDLTRIRRK